MGDARAEIAGRVDGVTGCTAQREADAPYQCADQYGAEARSETPGGDSLRRGRWQRAPGQRFQGLS